jgi:hypothetical protein
LTNRKKGISLGSFEKLLVNSKAFGVMRIRTYKFNIILKEKLTNEGIFGRPYKLRPIQPYHF